MILTRNLSLLENKFTRMSFSATEELGNNVVVEPSKSGDLTMKIKQGEDFVYIHSKYNPKREADIIGSNLDLSTYEHVIFLGLGLGYHIRSILEKNPHLTYSFYDEDKTRFSIFLRHCDLQQLDLNNLLVVSNLSREKYIQQQLNGLANIHFPKTYIYVLPNLKKEFTVIELDLLEQMKENLQIKKTNMITNHHFQKRWTTNVIHNFEAILNSPPILHSKAKFEGQTAFLVAAGPSLQLEYENLKRIHREKLGYIFSVGSAINSLLSQEILPDAAFTYDPGEHNQNVFKLLKERNIKEIPLVFGSTVGCETLKEYPGEKFHFVTSQDTISSYYISSIMPDEIIFDAPSIAIITYQILCELGFQKIILIGQNFAYFENLRYASGINYEKVSTTLTQNELQKAVKIKDVYGQDILTNEGFIRMKSSLEQHIQMTKGRVEVINTTRYGANIEGADFKELSHILAQIKTRDELDFNRDNRVVDKKVLSNRHSNLNQHFKKFEYLLEEVTKQKQKLEAHYKKYSGDELNKLYIKIDQKLTEIEKNKFYLHFVHPAIRSTRQLLEEGFKRLEYQNNLELKAKTVIKILSRFLDDTKETAEEMYMLVEQKRGI